MTVLKTTTETRATRTDQKFCVFNYTSDDLENDDSLPLIFKHLHSGTRHAMYLGTALKKPIFDGTDGCSGSVLCIAVTGSCADTIQDCSQYGQGVCNDPQYAAWVMQKCARTCNKCCKDSRGLSSSS